MSVFKRDNGKWIANKKITDQNGRLEKRSIYAFYRVFADKSQHRRRTTFESTN